MSIQPHAVLELDPFEGLDYIPSELRTIDPTKFVSVVNVDPSLDISNPHDFFGLEILLGGLAGVRPFGPQTSERVQARKAFGELVEAGRDKPKLLRDLGRVGFIDLAAKKPVDSVVLAHGIATEKPRGEVVIITPDTLGWPTLRQSLTELLGVDPYRATFERRKPATEKGMKWTIAGGPQQINAA